jgi:hypothetical protein
VIAVIDMDTIDYDGMSRTLHRIRDQVRDPALEGDLDRVIRRLSRLRDDSLMRTTSLGAHERRSVPTTALIAAE